MKQIDWEPIVVFGILALLIIGLLALLLMAATGNIHVTHDPNWTPGTYITLYCPNSTLKVVTCDTSYQLCVCPAY